ncbi:hypothetical protein [Arthrobacter sp. NPDC090010]|uniref:hypothetical protein n=1 Tax=Arthrobacter sp. NPDC090010 TaxID=3363942 RepID=UPI0037F58A4B
MDHLTESRGNDRMEAVPVFLEGVSDVAAVSSLARRRGLGLQKIRLVDLGGVTNIRRALVESSRVGVAHDALGLCDEGEARFVLKALQAIGTPVDHVDELPHHGFFLCRSDLEEELIRALGTRRTVAVVERLGLRPKLTALQQQPAWQGRPLAEQLHRFCGVASGRKELLAGELAAELEPGEEPEPLKQLLDRMSVASRRP